MGVADGSPPLRASNGSEGPDGIGDDFPDDFPDDRVGSNGRRVADDALLADSGDFKPHRLPDLLLEVEDATVGDGVAQRCRDRDAGENCNTGGMTHAAAVAGHGTVAGAAAAGLFAAPTPLQVGDIDTATSALRSFQKVGCSAGHRGNCSYTFRSSARFSVSTWLVHLNAFTRRLDVSSHTFGD